MCLQTNPLRSGNAATADISDAFSSRLCIAHKPDTLRGSKTSSRTTDLTGLISLQSEHTVFVWKDQINNFYAHDFACKRL